MEKLTPIDDQFPELLYQCFRPSALTAQVYHCILDFLTSQLTLEQVATFRPTQQIQDRLKYLLLQSDEGDTSLEEVRELDAYEHIEHLYGFAQVWKPTLTLQQRLKCEQNSCLIASSSGKPGQP